MTPATHDLFRAIVNADSFAVQSALTAGADVNSTDELGRSILAYAALGNVINAIGTTTRPRLSERSLDILRTIAQHPDLSLYSLNAPMPWAGGVTLLGLMSWLNMPSEIMCLLEYAAGLLEVDAMDEQGATPLMYAARDGRLKVVQRLLAHGARPDLKDVSQRSAIQHALSHSRILWLCEESVRRWREKKFTSSIGTSFRRCTSRQVPCAESKEGAFDDLFYQPRHAGFIKPPPKASFDNVNLRNAFDSLLRAVRTGNLSTLRMMLFPSSPNSGSQKSSVSLAAPLLVNFRDSAGLTLVHHAVSRRCPSIAILDALNLAGCDIGLYSTLGFTPLHHLVRTARDDLEDSKDELEVRHASPAVQTQLLYTYTMHIVRDLHAPLGATDCRGETPLHAAAEHGRSFGVLQAMLDYDSEFTGKGAVREARNERGLRPIDVAKPEFLPLFVVRRQTITRARSNSHLLTRSAPLGNPPQVRNVLPCGLPRSVAQHDLGRKESNASFVSEFSGGSSTSSDKHPHASCLSWNNGRSHPSTVQQKQCSPIEAPSSPFTDLFPPVGETHMPVDVSTCAHDVLHNLSLSASALYAFNQRLTNADYMNSLRELSEVSSTLHFTRNLASHVLEYWSARLEAAREDFERARREFGRTEVLLDQMARHVNFESKHHDLRLGSASVAKRRRPSHGVFLKDASVQTNMDGAEACEEPHSETTKEPSENGDVVIPAGTPQTLVGEQGSTGDECGVPKTLHARMEQRRAKDVKLTEDEQSTDESEDAGCAIGREVKLAPSTDLPPIETKTLLDIAVQTELPATWLDIAPRTLARVAQDMRNMIQHFIIVQQSFLRALQSLEQTRTLVLGSIQLREEQLDAVLHHRRDVSAQSFRLPSIQEQTHDVDDGKQKPEPKGADSTKANAEEDHAPSPPGLETASESQLLRRLLIRKLAKHVESVFDNLQKIHLWLRIIREVLRGLKRRALLEQ